MRPARQLPVNGAAASGKAPPPGIIRRVSRNAARMLLRQHRSDRRSYKVPVLFGNQSLPQDTLKADRKASLKIGPLGMGRRALYLNSFFFSRRYYVLWNEVKRVYKLVAMSKGGFTGIGAFGAMSYLVVELRDGRSKRCQVKYEIHVDEALEWIAKNHPERVRFTGVCHPFASIRETYLLEDFASTV